MERPCIWASFRELARVSIAIEAGYLFVPFDRTLDILEIGQHTTEVITQDRLYPDLAGL